MPISQGESEGGRLAPCWRQPLDDSRILTSPRETSASFEIAPSWKNAAQVTAPPLTTAPQQYKTSAPIQRTFPHEKLASQMTAHPKSATRMNAGGSEHTGGLTNPDETATSMRMISGGSIDNSGLPNPDSISHRMISGSGKDTTGLPNPDKVTS